MKNTLKDFLYLDLERVRSLSAQMFGGLVESQVNALGADASVKGELSGGIPTILNAKGISQLTASNLTTETKSIHHQLYTQFENELVDIGKVGSCYEDNKPFIKVNGQLQVINYTEIMDKIENVKTIMEYFKQVEEEKITRETDRNKRSILQAQIDNKFSLPSNYKNIINVIKTVYGDTIRFSVIRNGKEIIKSNLQSDFIQFKSSGIVTGSESLSEEEWTFLLRLNRKIPFYNPNPSENQIEESLAQLMLSFKQVTAFVEGATGYSVVPIAIYKDL